MENRTGKYFKYALGEIVLVVVGILIALQINNWNETRKERKVEVKYLNNLKRDLKKDSVDLASFIAIRKGKANAADRLLKMASEDRLADVHQISLLFVTVGFWDEFVPNDNSFKELINSGQLNIISNDSIKDLLMNLSKANETLIGSRNHMKREYDQYLYDNWFTTVNFLETRDQTMIVEPYDWFMPDKIFMEVHADKIRQEVAQLFDNTSFLNGLTLAGGNNQLLAETYNEMLTDVNLLIRLINRELGLPVKQ
jgi:hypothetical protein